MAKKESITSALPQHKKLAMGKKVGAAKPVTPVYKKGGMVKSTKKCK